MSDHGFHEGELLVQRRAGVDGEAQRLSGMLTEPRISEGMARFVAARDLVFLTAEDDHGHLWTSPVSGPRGFVEGDGRTLAVAGAPAPGDPLHDLGGLEIAVEQAFGNCPRYIHPREVGDLGGAGPTHLGTELEPGDVAQVRAADTFVLGTIHPERGADTSHRGGEPGFVRVADGGLWWPDYDGNNLFNSLGNIAVDPATSLLFLDAERGTTLQLSGRSSIEWAPTGGLEADEQTGRRVRFTPERVRRS